MTTIFVLLGALTSAHAVPLQLSQQGRLLDSAGASVNGIHTMTYRFYDSQFGGSILWEDNVTVAFEEGYYATLIGDSSSNPLDDSILSNTPVYLEVEFNGGGPIGGRQEVVSTPYARVAGTANSIDGGSVNASAISISGQLVVDANGSWVGPAMAVNWADVQNIPADLADGDNDSLAGLSCNSGQIVGWDGSNWICTDDNGLTEAQVESFITNDAIDLHAATTVGGLPILTQGDGDTLSGLACQNGDIARFDSVLGWQCDIDTDTSDWNALANVPAGFSDGIDNDTQLSEADVETFVVNGGLDLHPATTINGSAVMTNQACLDGQVLEYNAGTATWVCANLDQINTCSGGELLVYDSNANAWACTSLTDLMDVDQDGIVSWDDCNDNDPTVGSSQNDNDCDGHDNTIDCDNFDPNSSTINDDADCDGTLTADDCNDNDANSTTLANDADCDGVETADDCDDTDANSTIVANDADCDGIETANDCDDNNSGMINLGSTANCPAVNCLEILNDDPNAGDGAYWISPGGGTAIELYCDMTLDGGGWTLVYHNLIDAIQIDNTGQQGNVSDLSSPYLGFAKLSDSDIANLKTNSDDTIGYRVSSTSISQRYFSPSTCNYSHTDNGNMDCRKYTATYTTGTPNYIQCSDWGGGSGGLDAWYNCNGSWAYTNVFNTHRNYSETAGITTNDSGSTMGDSGTVHGYHVLMWVR